MVAVIACSCGSGGNPSAPGSATPSRIDILGDRGSQSFT
jgi:hypothetical protein